MNSDLLSMFETDFVKLAGKIIPGRDKMRKPVLNLLRHAYDRTTLYPASTKYHHCWAGWLADHISQVMALMYLHKDAIGDVPLWSIPVAAYLHDWEKHWKYRPLEPTDKNLPRELSEGPPTAIAALAVVPAFTYIELPGRFNPSTEIQTGILLERFKIPCSRELSNALMLSEGGWSPHAKDSGLDKLATVLHSADMISSHCYQDVSGAGAGRWKFKYFQDILNAHRRATPLGDGTWPR